ncbi:MAG: sigma 54-interacting transcriptional regulator [Oscillospiraceae bacterium]
MKDIVVVAPTPSIYEEALRIIEEYSYDNTEVVFGSMSEGVAKAEEALRAGAQIIVTRGGTYRMCREAFVVPVVEIKVSAYDIIETLKSSGVDTDVIGVVGYTNVVEGFDLLRDYLPCKIVKIELHSEDQIREVIFQYKKMGIQTFVGDANVIKISEALGFRGVVITSREESIRSAIREARRVWRAAQIEKQRARQLAAITDFVHDGVVAVDAAETVTICNQRAAEMLHIDKNAAIGKKIDELAPGLIVINAMKRGSAENGKLLSVTGETVAVNRAPIEVDGVINGAVATFQYVSEIQDMEQKIRRSLSKKGFVARYCFNDIIYGSESMRVCVEKAKEFAAYDAPVLICGESGVGKEMFAQSIHNRSSRGEGAFVAVNCAALPPSLIESELFGYDEGSFTGAKKQGKPGLFELAHHGTIFLDEIGEIPQDMQGRLLRVLQEKEVMRIGADKVIPIDVKVICGSNRDLKRMAADGSFRKDLYYRIDVLNLRIPPLRERREDIMLLTEFFNRMFSEKFGKHRLTFTEAAVNNLTSRSYDGNVRELQTLVERCVILSSLEELSACDCGGLPEAEKQQSHELKDLKAFEDAYIRDVYRQSGGSAKRTCEILKIDRSTLWRRLKQE